MIVAIVVVMLALFLPAKSICIVQQHFSAEVAPKTPVKTSNLE